MSVLSLMTAWTASADGLTELVGDKNHFTEHGTDALTARLYYSSDYGMWVVDLGLNNSQTYTTLQADLVVDSKLFEFTQDYDLTDRVKERSGMSGMTPTHTVTSHIWESGFLRMIIGSPTAKDVKGTEGTVCYFGLNVKEGATVDQTKEYPVNLTNIVLARNEFGGEKVVSQGYYLQGTIADPTYNCYDANCRSAAIYGSLSSDKEWDNFKVGVATTPWQVDIDLTQCTMTGLGRVAPTESEYNYQNRYNKNNLLYVKDAKQVNTTTNENVIVVSETPYTESLTLHDDGKLFYAKMDFAARKASYDRTFVKDKWSTLCLPFYISETELTALKSKYDIIVEELISFDAAEGKLCFDTAKEILPNHPYIIRTGSDCAPFKDMDFETNVSGSSVMKDVEMDGAKMFGTFTPLKVDSSGETVYYGFSSSKGEFFRIGKNATLPSFRACIAVTASPSMIGSMPVTLSLAHLVETSIEGVNAGNAASGEAVYNMQGHKLGAKAGEKLPKGVYIIGGKKRIIK